MSSLQLGLIAIGALIILSLLVYNWWQERVLRHDMVQRFDRPIDDVLMGKGAAQEPAARPAQTEKPAPALTEFDPGFADFPEPSPAAEPEVLATPFLQDDPQEPFVAIEPTATEFPPLAEAADVQQQERAQLEKSAPPSTLPAGMDSLIDDIALILLPADSSGDAIIRQLDLRADFGKPVQWFGWSANSWLPLTMEAAGRRFSAIAVALQLVDRSGPLQAAQLLEFQQQVKALSSQLNGALNWVETRDTLRHANMLDQFCIEVDVTVTMHVTAAAENPFAGTKLRGLLEAHGMRLKEDGRFHLLNDAGQTLYTLSAAGQQPFSDDALRTAAWHDVMLMMDVPHIPKGSETFRQMAQLGTRLESTLNARLTDANRRALGAAELDQIRTQIQALQAKIMERGITPGDPSALRLFS